MLVLWSRHEPGLSFYAAVSLAVSADGPQRDGETGWGRGGAPGRVFSEGKEKTRLPPGASAPTGPDREQKFNHRVGQRVPAGWREGGAESWKMAASHPADLSWHQNQAEPGRTRQNRRGPGRTAEDRAEPQRTRKKQDEAERSGKKREEAGRSRKKQEEAGRSGKP